MICPKKGKFTRKHEVLEDIDIYRYSLIYEGNEAALGYLVEFVWCWLATFVLSVRVFFKRRFKVIHACNPPESYFLLALLYRPLGVKFVFDHHDLSPEMFLAKGYSESSLLYKGLLLLERWTISTAHEVIEVNESHKRVAIERGGASADKVTIVRSGPPANWADRYNYNDDLKEGRDFLVVYLGEMCRQDGVDSLLRSIQIYKCDGNDDTQFTLIGSGPEKDRLRKLATEMDLDDTVKFTGYISDEVLISYLSTADVCVDPDPWTEWSNMSTMNKIIEYMALGRPIVAYDMVEHRYSAQGGAVYVAANDEEQYAWEIRKLLLDPDKREEMSLKNTERFINEISWDSSQASLLSIYSRLLPLT